MYWRARRAYSQRVAHLELVEGRVNDEVAVVTDDGPRLHLGHAKLGARRAEHPQVVQYFGVGEGYDLDRDALRPLRASSAVTQSRTAKTRRTLVPRISEFFR